MYCHQRSQYIRLNSKKNSFRGNYSRKYGIYKIRTLVNFLGDADESNFYMSFQMALHFNAVDNDNNGVIDVNEAFDHFARDKVMKLVHRFVTPVWFAKIDSDHNGIISPSEFDAQLSSKILEKFDLSNV